MTAPNPASYRLPARDYLILPLLCLVTIGAMTAAAVVVAERSFSKSETGVEKCMQNTDPAIGPHGKPNAVCFDKGTETQVIKYEFNNCGYRMEVECATPKPGTYRIVLIGSSMAMGQWVPLEKSMAVLLPGELLRTTGKKIEVYNEGMMSEHPQVVALRFSEVLASKPDMVLWVLTPYDIGASTIDPKAFFPADQSPTKLKVGLLDKISRKVNRAREQGITSLASEAWQDVDEKFLHSSAGVMLRHYLYQNPNVYVSSFLRGPDSEMGFLRTEDSAWWSSNLAKFDDYVMKIHRKANADDVTVAVVLAPNRAQATMISHRQLVPGIDPYKLGEQVRSSVENHDETYIDLLPDFRDVSDAETYYFPVDGHPNAKGHALLSKLIASEIARNRKLAEKIRTSQGARHPQYRNRGREGILAQFSRENILHLQGIPLHHKPSNPLLHP